jgi:hypothetical protein
MESAHPIWNLFGGELAVAMLIQVLSVVVHSPFNFFFLVHSVKINVHFLTFNFGNFRFRSSNWIFRSKFTVICWNIGKNA